MLLAEMPLFSDQEFCDVDPSPADSLAQGSSRSSGTRSDGLPTC